MKISNYLKLDLGIPTLWLEWKKIFSFRYLMPDLAAGVTVACVAIPLSLAIALASGVSPAAGLITAIIGGIVCALFGGTPLAVSGPAAAMSILIANCADEFGIKGVIFVCLMVGTMQLLSGVLRLGRFSRFVPFPVVAAFTSGIGVIIIVGQLPRVFGLPQPDQSHIFTVAAHLWQYLPAFKLSAVIIVVATVAFIKLLPRWAPRIPAAIFAVIIATAVVKVFSLKGVDLVGEIPRTLPLPKLPMLTTSSTMELMLVTFTIYLLACLESLLSSNAVDKLVKTEKHDPDQELVGQGLGNIVTSLFGGLPLTSVIVRSALNVRSGAKTRRASIIHALIILLTVFVAAPLISMIPIAALAGVLLVVAFSMINYQEFLNLVRTSHSEAAIYAITFLTIIFIDLIAGVEIGILAACLIVFIRASKAVVLSHHSKDAIRLSLNGPLTFLSLSKITELEKNLPAVTLSKPVILNLAGVTDLDSSGASSIVDFLSSFRNRGFHIFTTGVPQRFESLFKVCDEEGIFKASNLLSERELTDRLSIKSFHGRLLHGVQKFHNSKENYRRLFKRLATQQDPHTLFITCSDSRIITSMITQSDPGELFIIRNVGNFIPPYSCDENHSEIAALEFALTQLDIREIVVCGHSSCGAIKACCVEDLNLPAQLQSWISRIKQQLNFITRDVNELAKQNVVNQIETLKQYPLVKQKLDEKLLHIHGWFISFEKHEIYEWNRCERIFKPIGKV